jgi:hypothetical protein
MENNIEISSIVYDLVKHHFPNNSIDSQILLTKYFIRILSSNITTENDLNEKNLILETKKNSLFLFNIKL